MDLKFLPYIVSKFLSLFNLELLQSICSVLFSGFIAGGVWLYFSRICKEMDKVRETANYAKLLYYECEHNTPSYTFIAEHLHKIPIWELPIPEHALWREIIQLSSLDDEIKTNLKNAISNLLSESDQEFWEKNKKKFIHLPSKEFEILHKYFAKSRKTINFSLDPFRNHIMTETHKTMAKHSLLITYYLQALIRESSRSFIQYMWPFKYRFTNKSMDAFQELYKNFKKESNA